jgi:hypothetical protein
MREIGEPETWSPESRIKETLAPTTLRVQSVRCSENIIPSNKLVPAV